MGRHIRIMIGVAIMAFIFSSPPCFALVLLPQDTGIDYSTMKVVDPAKLRAQGMRRAQIGDAVTLGAAEAGGVTITNKRTGERVRWSIPR